MNALTTLIENWLDTLGAHSTTLKTVTGRDVDSLVLVLEAHWRARPEAWQASADTLRKLREQWAEYQMLKSLIGRGGSDIRGYKHALSIMGLLDIVVGEGTEP